LFCLLAVGAARRNDSANIPVVDKYRGVANSFDLPDRLHPSFSGFGTREGDRYATEEDAGSEAKPEPAFPTVLFALPRVRRKFIRRLSARSLTSPVDGSIVMTGLVPVIHVVKLPDTLEMAGNGATWMTGTSPVMTEIAV
jgi:hypothetical protein